MNKYHIVYYDSDNGSVNFILEAPQNQEGMYEVQDLSKALTDLERWKRSRTGTDYKLAVKTKDGNLVIFNEVPSADFLKSIPFKHNGYDGLITWLMT